MARLPRPEIDRALLTSEQDVPYDEGRMPKVLYEGIWAHHIIQLFYRSKNPGHQIYTDLNFDRIASITVTMVPMRLHARMRPDILDVTLHKIWEIKSLRRQPAGAFELELYRNAIGRSVFVTAGGPSEGTEGTAYVPGGYVSFDVRVDGVIRYQYFRTQS